MKPQIPIDRQQIADFCRRHHISRPAGFLPDRTGVQLFFASAPFQRFMAESVTRQLSLFVSVLREDFRPDSDIDVLVEFESAHTPGFLRLSMLEDDLSQTLVAGRSI